MNRIDNMVVISADDGHAGRVTLPTRKRLNHRGPLSIDVSSAWYFITICAEGHAPWVMAKPVGRAVAPRLPDGDAGRAVAPRPPSPTTSLGAIAPLILRKARENHNRGIWRLALFLVMPDHLHFIVNIGGRGATALPKVIANSKHLLSARYGLRFQRDFFDTRLRDDAHFAEEYDYILGNPVRKGLCATPEEWPYSIAFSRTDGTETATLVGARRRDGRADMPPSSCGCAQPVGSRVPRDHAGRAVAPRPPSAEVMSEERKAI